MRCRGLPAEDGRRRSPPARPAFTRLEARWTAFGVERTICDMARVTYESTDDAGHKFWVAHYGRYVIRIDANRPGVYRWLISLEGRSVRNGLASDRDHADAAVSAALDELPR
jgi:hypothetical protein